MTKPKTIKNERAQLIADKVAEQVRTLITRDWPEINAILDEKEGGEGEINLSFKTLIRDRAATPGEEAAKDNQLRTVMSFSTKFSDSLESEIPNQNQPDLPRNEEPPTE